MPESHSKSELIAGMAEEFVARYRAGERPPISEYAARRPELAHEIREFFEAVALIENLAPADSRTVTGPEFPTDASGEPTLDRLGDYRIIREVGRGGMGVVYEAEQLSLGRHVALKVLPAQLLVDDKQRLRFEREAKAAARLHHTNIVPVFGVGHEAGTHYYVMQFIQGKGLDAVLDDLRQLRLQQTLSPPPRDPSRREGGEDKHRSDDVTASALAKSLLAGAFPGTDHGPIDASETDATDVSSAAEAAQCRGGSPLTPPSVDSNTVAPALGNEPTLLGSDAPVLPSERAPATASPAGGVMGLPPRQQHDRLPPPPECRGGSSLTPPSVGSSAAQRSLGNEPTLLGSDDPALPSERDPASASPAGGVTGLPPRQQNDRLPPDPECRGGSPLTPPSGASNAVPPALGNEPTLLGSDTPALPSVRDPATASPAGGVTGLPPRQPASSPLLLPSDSSSSFRSKARNSTYWESIARVGTQVASALQYAHDQGVLHRDIKPSNLLLDLRGQVWITDFGLAKAEDQQDLTHTGDILGTLRYMPPEAFDGKADRRGDIYALGLTLYEMLAFRPAYDERDRRKLIQQVTEANPDRLERIDKTIPRDLATIIHKAIEREPAHRYQKAQDLADDLQRFVNDEPIHARRISSIERFVRWRRRNRTLATSLVSLALVLATVAVGSAIAAGYFGRLNRELRTTVGKLQTANEETREAQEIAEQKADENLELAESRTAALGRVERIAEERQRVTESQAQQLYVTQVQLAQQAWQEPLGVHRMSLLLDPLRPSPGEPDRRNWEWFYLKGLPYHNRMSVPQDDLEAYCVRFSPDGEWLVSASQTSPMKKRNLVTGELVEFEDSPYGSAKKLDWSPDGQWIVTADFQAGLGIWDVQRATLTKNLNLTQKNAKYRRLDNALFSPNGRWILGATNCSIIVWDANSLDVIEEFPMEGPENRFYCVSWVPQNPSIAIQNQRDIEVREFPGFALRWQQPSLQVKKEYPHSLDVACSSDARFLAALDETGLTLRDPATGNLIRRLDVIGSEAVWIRFSRNSHRLLVASADGVLRVFDVDTAEQIALLRGHISEINDLDESPVTGDFVTAAKDGVRLWKHARRQDVVRILPDARGRVKDFAWGPDGTRLATVGAFGCRIVDESTQRAVHEFETTDFEPDRLVWHPQRDWVLCTQHSGGARLFDLSAETEIPLPPEIRLHARRAAWSPDGTMLSTVSGIADSIVLWNVDDWSHVGELTALTNFVIDEMYWSPDQKWLATHLEVGIGTIRIWNMASRKVDFEIPFVDNAIAWSHSGKFIALSRGKPLWILSTGDWKHVGLLSGHMTNNTTVDWSRDDSRICTGSQDQTVKLWSGTDYSQVFNVHNSKTRITKVQWSPDSTQLAWLDLDGVVSIADARPGMEQELSPRLLGHLDQRLKLQPAETAALALRRKVYSAVGEENAAERDAQQLWNTLNETSSATREQSAIPELTRLWFDQNCADWKAWDPDQFTSRGGQPKFKRPDGGFFVDFTDVSDESFFLTGSMPVRRLTAIRLETIPDPLLPGSGAGWGNGSFLLTGIRAWVLRTSGEAEPLRFREAICDYEGSADRLIKHADATQSLLDDDHLTLWSCTQQNFISHWIELALESPVELDGGERIQIELQMHSVTGYGTLLGRFRLQVTDNTVDRLREVLSTAHQRHLIENDVAWALTQLLDGDPHGAQSALQRVNAPGARGVLLLRALAENLQGASESAERVLSQAVEELSQRRVATWERDLLQSALAKIRGLTGESLRQQTKMVESGYRFRRLKHALLQNPSDLTPRIEAAFLLGSLGELRQSVAEFASLLNDVPMIALQQTPVRAGPLYRKLGDETGGQTYLQNLLTIDHSQASPMACSATALSCLLFSDSPETANAVSQLVERGLSDETRDHHQALPWTAKALHALRLKQCDTALSAAVKSRGMDFEVRDLWDQKFPTQYVAMDYAIEAQAHVYLADLARARECLVQAERVLALNRIPVTQNTLVNLWYPRLIAELLVDEATQLLMNQR